MLAWARIRAIQQRGASALLARRAESGGGWVLAEGASEAAEGAATTGSERLTFEPGHSSHAQPSLGGEFFLGQTPLTA
jgi:hypothetical protein